MALDYRSEYQRYRHYYTYLGNFTRRPVFRAYFSVTISLLTIAIFTAFAIRPTLATIITLRKEISDKTELNKQLDNKLNSLTALQIVYQQVEPDLPLVTLAVPTTPQTGEAVSYLEKTAAASNLKLDAVTAKDINYQTSATTAAVPISINITLDGNSDNILYFLDQINSLPRLLSVDQVTITKDTFNIKNGLTAQLVLSTNFFP